MVEGKKALIGPEKEPKSVKGRFRPTPDQLKEYCEKSAKALEKADDEVLGSFTEHGSETEEGLS